VVKPKSSTPLGKVTSAVVVLPRMVAWCRASPQAEPYRVTSPVLLVTEDVTGLVVPVVLLPDATLSRVTDLPGFFGIYHEHLTTVDVRRLAAEG
jgi:hypothetical protein